MGKSPFKQEGYIVESTQPFKLNAETVEGHGQEDEEYDDEYDNEVEEEEKVFHRHGVEKVPIHAEKVIEPKEEKAKYTKKEKKEPEIKSEDAPTSFAISRGGGRGGGMTRGADRGRGTTNFFMKERPEVFGYEDKPEVPF